MVSPCFYKQAALERALPHQMLLVLVLRKQQIDVCPRMRAHLGFNVLLGILESFIAAEV